jgi:hypothetical protein
MKGTRMLRSPIVFAGLSCAIAIGAYVAGCDSTTEEVVDQTGRQPPPPPANAPPANGPGAVFAMNKLFLGGTDRNGNPSKTAWKEYGYNLDKKISTAASTDVCKPNAGGSPKVHDDGTDGIDNAFGKELWPIIQGLAPTAEADINESIVDGQFTIIVDMTNLGPEANYLDILGKLYAGTEMADPPVWDGSDMWPVAPELLENPSDIGSAKVVFPKSYLNNNTWVSGTPGTINLAVSVQGTDFNLSITQATITMKLDAAHEKATDGVIAGIIQVETLISELQKVAGSFSSSLCEGTTFDSIANQLRQASDILSDGSQDPSKTCDGISIGLGFESLPIQLGEVSDPSPPGPDPCSSEGGSGGEPQGGSGGTPQGGAGGTGGA